MSNSYPAKDPDEVFDYLIDWTKRLDGDIITASSWTISSNTGLTMTANSFSNTVATIWLANGTSGKMAILTNSINTLAGRTWEVNVNMLIKT